MAATTQQALDLFSPSTRNWFREAFESPTSAQERGWEAIASGEHTLLLAPTGSGKTLAAFLWCLDQLVQRGPVALEPGRKKGKRAGVSVLYISPLKALTYDVERNLRAPLAGLRVAALREGLEEPDITVGTRTGDTPLKDRDAIRRDPPDILITTPESLYLMLTSRSREVLRTVRTVIVDEIHTMAGTKRGSHLALSLERLEEIVSKPPQRIGLSATQRPLDEVAKYLAGDRKVAIVDAGATRSLELKVIVPLEDMSRPAESIPPEVLHSAGANAIEARTSIWPAVYPKLLEAIRAHRSTLIFVNNRRLAERLAARLNEMAGEELVRAHHGSVSREQRSDIEEKLKAGELPALACTSSLELGIDMGAVDLVIQVESSKSVARGLQRVGRAGHQVGGTSRGLLFPKFRGDLLECAVLTQRMRAGLIEATVVPKNPIDVLAQQVVAMCAAEEMSVDAILALARRTYSFRDLSREALESVLGMLSGEYPSDEFADLRPRVIWDREADTVRSRNDARTVAIINGGTIPDRGLYGVFLGEGGPRVGELDEEMVYESRPGETFVLGASTWRIEQITRDQVIVTPAPGEPGKMPFWKGDTVGRPYEFGRAIGAFVRDLGAVEKPARAMERLKRDCDLDDLAASNLVAYLQEEHEATGALPTDRTVVVERFRDELGDWRIVILTPFGGQVHAGWALAIEAKLSDQSGFEVQTLYSDDGIALRFADTGEGLPEGLLFPDPDEVEDLVVRQLAGSALFAGRFRENAGRALLLPRRRPGARSPLWQQRQKASNLLAVASRYGSFPIILETYRECLADVMDLAGLKEVLRAIQTREIRTVSVETNDASPFARSLLFDYVAQYMYEGDAPLAERRAQALALDRTLLRDLLGEAEFRELLDPDALISLELELQALEGTRKARNADQLHDLLRRVGDLSAEEVGDRCTLDDPAAALAVLESQRRACRIRVAGGERWIAIEDAGRYRDAIGSAPPLGVPEVFLRPTEDSLGGLVARYARTHAPFVAAEPAARWGLPVGIITDALRELERASVVIHGEFRPGGVEAEWCDPDVLKGLRRRSLARLRREVEPVDQVALARFVASWQGLGSPAKGLDRLRDILTQLEGYPVPVSALERDVLPARMADYNPRLLDELGAAGELTWLGRGSLGNDDGRIALYRRDRIRHLAPPPPAEQPAEELHRSIVAALGERGALFYADLVGVASAHPKDVLEALWNLAWAGIVTNDTFGALRGLNWPKRTGGRRGRGSLVPPEAAGRWSLTVLAGEGSESVSTARSHTLATSLLERHGVVTRESVASEGIPGGFSAVYSVLKAMEETGKVRRGYFVDGLGAAQFALPAAVERLRACRVPSDEPSATVLAATDPANLYGAALPWPRREESTRRNLQRAAGAYVVLVDGQAVLYLERGARSLVTLTPVDDQETARIAADGLVRHAATIPRGLTLERIDGAPYGESPLAPVLESAGFVRGYRGLGYRAAGAERRRA